MKLCLTCLRRYQDEAISCLERGHAPLEDECMCVPLIEEINHQVKVDGSSSVRNVIGVILILVSLAMSIFVIWRLAHISSPPSDSVKISESHTLYAKPYS